MQNARGQPSALTHSLERAKGFASSFNVASGSALYWVDLMFYISTDARDRFQPLVS